MLINFAWPRAASNPKPNETVIGTGKSATQLLNFHLSFLNGIPILWTVVVVIALIGVIYYAVAGRNKQFPAVVAPAGEDAPLAV